MPNLHYGVIQAQASGDATIVASDSAGAGGSYPVVVTSVTPPPGFEDFTLQPAQHLNIGQPVTLATMKVTLVEGVGRFEPSPVYNRGLRVGDVSSLWYPCRIRLDLNLPRRSISLSGYDFRSDVHSFQAVLFFGVDGSLVRKLNIESTYPDGGTFDIDFSSPEGVPIGCIELLTETLGWTSVFHMRLFS